MNIYLNGEQSTCEADNLSGLLDNLELLEKRIAVEFNGEICPRSQWASQSLTEGDVIEIVHAIGGG